MNLQNCVWVDCAYHGGWDSKKGPCPGCTHNVWSRSHHPGDPEVLEIYQRWWASLSEHHSDEEFEWALGEGLVEQRSQMPTIEERVAALYRDFA